MIYKVENIFHGVIIPKRCDYHSVIGIFRGSDGTLNCNTYSDFGNDTIGEYDYLKGHFGGSFYNWDIGRGTFCDHLLPEFDKASLFVSKEVKNANPNCVIGELNEGLKLSTKKPKTAKPYIIVLNDSGCLYAIRRHPNGNIADGTQPYNKLKTHFHIKTCEKYFIYEC